MLEFIYIDWLKAEMLYREAVQPKLLWYHAFTYKNQPSNKPWQHNTYMFYCIKICILFLFGSSLKFSKSVLKLQFSDTKIVLIFLITNKEYMHMGRQLRKASEYEELSMILETHWKIRVRLCVLGRWRHMDVWVWPTRQPRLLGSFIEKSCLLKQVDGTKDTPGLLLP